MSIACSDLEADAEADLEVASPSSELLSTWKDRRCPTENGSGFVEPRGALAGTPMIPRSTLARFVLTRSERPDFVRSASILACRRARAPRAIA